MQLQSEGRKDCLGTVSLFDVVRTAINQIRNSTRYFCRVEFFYSENITGNEILLGDDESHHCLKVMRHHLGDELMVTDGKGKLFRAILESERKKNCVLKVLEISREESQVSPAIHIAIAPTKNIDRFEWFLEKATEIGVTEITPIICQRSERDKIKHERLEKILIGAMKQSLRLWMPKLNEMISIKNFFTHDSQLAPINRGLTTHDFICHCQSPNIPALKSLCQASEDVTIMIGPEGDFTPEEIGLAEANGFTGVTLGKNRLRTETAGIVSLTIVQNINNLL
jgi:16S rRNA (uracil1498-N3)-methyltransferase